LIPHKPHPRMQELVVAHVLADHEVGRAIVRSDLIDMVDYGLWWEALSKGTLGNENMFADIAIRPGC
jgi:hypothetical protein